MTSPRPSGGLCPLLLLTLTLSLAQGLRSYHQAQQQRVEIIRGENMATSDHRIRRDAPASRSRHIEEDPRNITSIFDLKDHHLHLMVHWAGKGSSIVFCLARDQEVVENSTSRLFLSQDYGTTFNDISSRFLLEVPADPSGPPTGPRKQATITKFFHHPNNNCFYVFTDVFNKQIFVSQDCGETVASYHTDFSPIHVEFDTSNELRFVIHDREDPNRVLYVTEDLGVSFSKVGEFVKLFYFHYEQSETVLYIARQEPSGKCNILSSSSFFQQLQDTKIVYNGADEFEIMGKFLFVVKGDGKGEDKTLYIAKHGQRFAPAQFPLEEDLPHLCYYVADVSEDEGIMVIVNHSPTHSNLYVSDVVSEYEAKFSLSLSRVMFYSPGSTWRSSWLDQLNRDSGNSAGDVDSTMADFYRVAGLRGVYIVSQLQEGINEKNIRPNNLTTKITFDAGAVWNDVVGPNTDSQGNIPLGCYQETNCSLHIGQQLSRRYPATRTIPILTSQAAPGIVLATGNMGKNLMTKTSVYLSMDAGLSWQQVLQGNYYYNIGDHGGVIVAVKYFKTEGDTNELLYSLDEGITWHSHTFYPTPIRIFGLITEPGENTTVFTMFGTKAKSGQPIDWIIVKVDLGSVFERNCTDEDYKEWSPRSPSRLTDTNTDALAAAADSKTTLCVMGRRDVFRRRAPLAKCYNGADLTLTKRSEVCPCTRADYRCDFGYIQDSGAEGCVRDPGWDHPDTTSPANCPPDTFYTLTKGYVKNKGDVCEGGLATRYEPEQRACPTDLSAHRTFMLVALRSKVGKIDLSDTSSMEVLPLVGVKNVIAMDLDYESDCIFWADLETDRINKQCLSNSSQVEVLVSTNLKSVEGMAYDQISKILYFVDGIRKTIELVKVNCPHGDHIMRKTILNSMTLGEKSKPRGVTVHPKQGYLFYSDWADKAACIGRSHLDGSNHTIIVNTNNNRGQPQVKWPNGLTVDTVAERLYWVDAQLDLIFSANLDGGDLKKVVSARLEVSHPFAVAVFKELVYWDDWTRKGIFQANKNSGERVLLVKDGVPGAMDLKIYSPNLLREKNACSNHSCSHICIALPPHHSTDKSGASYRCLCPDGMKAVGEGGETQCVCPQGEQLFANGTCSASKIGGLCDNSSQWQCANSLCIPTSWRCDGHNDCGDMSDETEGCGGVGGECRGRQFKCSGSGKCIPEHWRCDYEPDCEDASDEADCERLECEAKTQFRCDNGQCINKKWRCDFEKDCHDGSDETNCSHETTQCANDQIMCELSRTCMPKAWRCDGDIDCPGGSDEQNCTASATCQDWQFRCDNGHCIFATWQCDGQPDCMDGSDEVKCENRTSVAHVTPPPPQFPTGDCNEWMYKCRSEQCIPYWWKCDGVNDCSDGSDEEECSDAVLKPQHGEQAETGTEASIVEEGCKNRFQCHNGDCVWGSWVCDGEADCQDGEDEDPHMCKDKVRCVPGHFMCKLTGTCVSMSAMCNGISECEDGSDEEGCTASQGEEDEGGDVSTACPDFVCDLGENCLTWSEKCDGFQDCMDGSDEEMCEHWTEERAVAGLTADDSSSTADSILVHWFPVKAPNATHHNYIYKVGFSMADHADWRNSSQEYQQVEDWEYRLQGLQPGTRYQIRIYVQDAITMEELHHAPSTEASTRDGVPSPPRDLTLTQVYTTLVLSWLPPADPRGELQLYQILVRDTQGKQIMELKEPVLPGYTGRVSKNVTGLAPDLTYSFTVLAVNRAETGEPSQPIIKLLLQSIGPVQVTDQDSNSVILTWTDDHGHAVNYTVEVVSTSNPLEKVRRYTARTTQIHLVGLAPASRYTFRIWGNMAAGGQTPPSGVRVSTPGPALPAVRLDNARLVPGGSSTLAATAVMLAWSHPPPEPTGRHLTYGVWYGESVADMNAAGARYIVEGRSWILPAGRLQPCREYIFAVAVMGSEQDEAATGVLDSEGVDVRLAHGVGPASNYRRVATEFDQSAQPRDLRATNETTVEWKAPCAVLPKPLGYKVTVKEMVSGLVTKTDMGSTREASGQYTLPQETLKPGAIYQVSVSQGPDRRGEAPTVTLRGPRIPSPTSVYLHTNDHQLTVSWARVNVTGLSGVSPSHVRYTVLISPEQQNSTGSSHNFLEKGCSIRCAQCVPARVGPQVFNFSELFDSRNFAEANCSDESYTVAVNTVILLSVNGGEHEYSSAWRVAQRTIIPFHDSQLRPDQIVVEESSAVGTAVVVILVILALGSALGYFMFKHRRLRRTFQEFAATHYSSATGSATLLDDDDESPIIRGFSDDEPLVIHT